MTLLQGLVLQIRSVKLRFVQYNLTLISEILVPVINFQSAKQQ